MIRRISPIRPIAWRFLRSDGSNFPRLAIVFAPLGPAMLSKKILKIEQQLIQTGTSNVHETQLRLARRRSCSASFGDVLPAATRSLHHLIASPRPLVNKTIAE